MIFHVNPLPREDSNETSNLFSSKDKTKKKIKKIKVLSSAAVLLNS